MAILAGALTVRRFRVDGEVPEGFRDTYRDQLQAMAFAEPPVVGKEEVEGWVQVHNLLDGDFDDFNRWLYGHYALFALRIDKRTLPAKLFKATLAKKCQAWCEENGAERCPRTVKDQLRDDLETLWLKRVLPRVTVAEAAWNLNDGTLVLASTSERIVDRFRGRFHRTFGLQLLPWSPLDFIQDDTTRDSLIASSPAVLGMGGAL